MFHGSFTSGSCTIAFLTAVGIMFNGVMSASAEEADSNPANDVITASPVVGEASLAPDQAKEIDGNVIVAESDHGAVSVTLPVLPDTNPSFVDGLVVLSDDDSSDIVPVTLTDGSIAIHSILNDSTAPTSYRYTFGMNGGTKLVLDETDGSVTAVNSDGVADFFVAAPWATDANGEPVSTHYTVDGNSLVQHVQVGPSTAFPVVADPWLGIDLVSSFGWTLVSGSGYKLNIDPTFFARTITGALAYMAVGEAGWSELYNKMPSSQRSRMNASAKGQYICHMGFAGFDPQWNLETWKPAKNASGWITSLCN